MVLNHMILRAVGDFVDEYYVEHYRTYGDIRTKKISAVQATIL